MRLLIRLPIFVLMWAAYLLIKIPVAVLGLVVIPLLWQYRTTHYADLPRWTIPWANPEDWEGHGNGNNSLPLWWIKSRGNTFKEFYQYHAIRNPANGLRSFEWLDMDIEPKRIRFVTNMKVGRYEPSDLRAQGKKTGGYFAWQGFKAGFEIMHIWSDERHLVIKFGWRVEPRFTVDDIPDLFLDDAGFASKFLLYREG